MRGIRCIRLFCGLHVYCWRTVSYARPIMGIAQRCAEVFAFHGKYERVFVVNMFASENYDLPQSRFLYDRGAIILKTVAGVAIWHYRSAANYDLDLRRVG